MQFNQSELIKKNYIVKQSRCIHKIKINELCQEKSALIKWYKLSVHAFVLFVDTLKKKARYAWPPTRGPLLLQLQQNSLHWGHMVSFVLIRQQIM